MGVKTYPILYGLSSNGAVKQWRVWVEGDDKCSVIITLHGQKGGKIQESSQKVTQGKNIGRSNETTHFEQACSEAESKWTKQHDKNYSETAPVGKSVGGTKILPMLAQKYNERHDAIKWPAFVQPKLNGVRCLVQRVGDKIIYWSRKAKQYKNLSYMDGMFLSFMSDGEILDGEVYNHGDITFQELTSLIKDEKTPDLNSLKKYVKFHCYDRPDGDECFKDRYLNWKYGFSKGLNIPYMGFVTTICVANEKEMKALHGIFVEEGYEGTMIRSGGDGPYVFQYRNTQLQKYKDFIDEEFVIVGCKDGKGKDEHKAIFRCQSKSKSGGGYGDGSFDVRCKGTVVEREDQWKNRKSYMGKQLTVRYQTLSDEGIPIFPVGIVVRDYE